MTMHQIRRQLGWSVTQFAEAMGVTPNTVWRWSMSEGASGYRIPSETAWILARLLLARRWEADPDDASYREPGGSAKAFTEVLLAGYRPHPNKEGGS